MENRRNKVIPFSASKLPKYNAENEKSENAVGTRLDEAIRMRGLNQKELSILLGTYGVNVSNHAVSKWVVGGAVPNAYQLLAICSALQIDDGLSYFTKEFTPSLNKEGLRKVEDYRADLIASGKYKPESKSTSKIRYIEMPISNLSVSAGTGNFLDEGNFEMVSYPENSIPEGAEFGIRVAGNSMEPVYHDGHTVWVRRCETIEPGQVGVFIYGGEGYLKMYSEQQPEDTVADAFTDSYGNIHMQPVLVSYNQSYADMVISPDIAFQVIGRVL